MTFDQIKTTLAGYSVGICGAGGLGSNCALSLVRSGIGKIIIADFDIVSASNLNRQFYFFDQLGRKKVEALKENLLKVNPDLDIEIIDKKLNGDDIVRYFSACDVLVEAFDDKAAKQMLIEAALEFMPEKPLVAGIGMAGWGDNASLHTEVFDHIYICGDQRSEISEELPPLGPRVGIVANMQANVVLEILLGKM